MQPHAPQQFNPPPLDNRSSPCPRARPRPNPRAPRPPPRLALVQTHPCAQPGCVRFDLICCLSDVSGRTARGGRGVGLTLPLTLRTHSVHSVHSLTRPSTHSTHAVTPLTHPLHSLLTHSVTHSLIHSVSQSLTHPLTHSLHSLTHSTHSLLHSTHSLTQGVRPGGVVVLDRQEAHLAPLRAVVSLAWT